MRPVYYFFILSSAFSALSVLGQISEISAPQLDEFLGRKVVVRIPNSYATIVKRSPDAQWNTIEYDVTIKPASSRHLPLLCIQVIRWPLSRAIRKGNLIGAPFQITDSISGVYKENANSSEGCFASLTIPFKEVARVLYIKISPLDNQKIKKSQCGELIDLSKQIFKKTQIK